MSIQPVADGLIAPTVGSWAKRKYHFLGRYLDAFTTAMKDKKWGSLHYIDLFAAAGKAQIRDTEEVVLTSAAIAATVRHPFQRLHLAEVNPLRCDALRARLAPCSLPEPPHIHQMDANEAVSIVVREVPSDALCVAFIDPYGLHFKYESLRTLATLRTDVIILLPDHMDVLRNWREHYDSDPESNLDLFMPPGCGWRDALRTCAPDRQAERIRTLYEQGLRSIGYEHFDYKRISNEHGRALYILLYASRAKVGADIWRRVCAIDEQGQRDLFVP